MDREQIQVLRFSNLCSLWLKSLYVALRDFVFPPVCVGCEKCEVEQGLVCPQCLEALDHYGMPALRVESSGLTCVRALGCYGPPFSTLVHELKYRNRKSLARVLGKSLAGLLRNDPSLSRADVLVPIPLHPARLRERGYNQSQLLAQQVSARTGIPTQGALRRVRNTRSQVTLDHAARLKNLKGAFALASEAQVTGKTVVLIDDVSTTGATLSVAAEVLKQAGASAVYGLTVAGRVSPG